MRYHKKIYFPNSSRADLKDFTCRMNNTGWKYTQHTLDHIRYRAIDIQEVLQFIKGLTLNAKQVFEYYTEGKDDISKVCYRIPYIKGEDIILVVGSNKQIITIYYNNSKDKHLTLKEELYAKK